MKLFHPTMETTTPLTQNETIPFHHVYQHTLFIKYQQSPVTHCNISEFVKFLTREFYKILFHFTLRFCICMCNKSNTGNLSKQLFENDNQYVSLIILKLFFFLDYTYQVQSIFSVYSTQFIYLMYKNRITFFTYNLFIIFCHTKCDSFQRCRNR